MRAWVKAGLAIAVAAALGGGASFGWLRPNQPADAAVSVPTATAMTRSMSRTVTATGVVRPITGAEIKVGAQVAGELVSVPVKVGDRIAKGALLARIDPATYRAKADQAEAALRQSEAEFDYARLEHDRKSRLLRSEAGSAQALDAARFALDSAEAKRRIAAAALKQARIELDHTTVTAPIGGIVAEVSIREGETLSMQLEMPSLVTIIDLARLEVRAYVDETDIGRVQLGQAAVFSVDTYADREIPATVTAIEPKPRIENGVVNYIAVLDFAAPPDIVIRPEMTAHVKLTIGDAASAITIPRSALRRDGSREFVRLRQGDAWTDRTVVTGWRDDTAVEIREGVAAGDVVQLNTF
jgi:RND family efflux transporter MFP subunit